MNRFALCRMTHHDAVSVERAEPARREDCGCGRRGATATRRPFAASVQCRSSSLLTKLGRTLVVGVRMLADADRRASVTIALTRQVRD